MSAGETRLLTHAPDGAPATDPGASAPTDGSTWVVETIADLSADGSTVVVASDLSTLIPGDTNGDRDVFAAELGRRRLRLGSR